MGIKMTRFLGLEIPLKHLPELDASFIPLSALFDAHEKKAAKVSGAFAGIAVERAAGCVSAIKLRLEGTDGKLTEADKYLVERLAKTMLWVYGGYKIIVSGCEELSEYLAGIYKTGGKRGFDADFMSMVYEKPFTVIAVSIEEMCFDAESSGEIQVNNNLNGCRIGFDAGGSDMKVSAVIDGEAVFSEEIVWNPKINADPAYHYGHIISAMKLAASKMPRVDGIGISSAGIYVDNKTMVASLFIKVPKPLFDEHVRDIYIRAVKEIGDIPLVVANDGDVAALAGAMEYNDAEVLGIAMGTSQAGGYVNSNGGITGWLNELAFAPVDANPGAMEDEWSGDIGCGVKYFSQDGVIKLAEAAGIGFNGGMTPAEKLTAVQELLKTGDTRAAKIFESIGVYLGYTIAYYSRFYKLNRVILMGRVMSGSGGTLILDGANKVLSDGYPALVKKIILCLPDEKSRRVGQSVAAASLPVIR